MDDIILNPDDELWGMPPVEDKPKRKRGRPRKEKKEKGAPEPVEIVVVLDKSGSMGSKISDVIGGFNTFLDKQRELEGDAYLTLITFNGSYTMHGRTHVKKHKKLDHASYLPGGSTALLDAVGAGITHLETLSPSKAIVVIMTDGEENSSYTYSKAEIKDLITKHTEEGWMFVYLGANVDAFAEASSMGIAALGTRSYDFTSTGIKGAYVETSGLVADYRTSGKYSSMSVSVPVPVEVTLTAPAEVDPTPPWSTPHIKK